jgi:hypothetical protein
MSLSIGSRSITDDWDGRGDKVTGHIWFVMIDILSDMHKIICNDSEGFIGDLSILPYLLDIALRPLGYNNLSSEFLAVFLRIHEEGKSYQFFRSENERGWFRRRQWFNPISEHASISGRFRMFYLGYSLEVTNMDMTLPSSIKDDRRWWIDRGFSIRHASIIGHASKFALIANGSII